MKITLITCTHERPGALALCCSYIKRFTRRPDRWVVIDDGKQGENADPECLGVLAGIVPEYVRREVHEGEPQHTLPLNILEMIAKVKFDEDEWLVFVEDDDWYAPDYLNWVEAHVPGRLLIGQSLAMYYRLLAREYMRCGNINHASLAATCMNARLLPVLEQVSGYVNNPFVDLRLWGFAPKECRLLLTHKHVVGIKQFPEGWQGITMGWTGGGGFRADMDGSILLKWVGKVDTENYHRIIQNASVRNFGKAMIAHKGVL